MSLGLLGEGFDLHTGGLDLKFPHHENERAQAVALGRHFAQHWAHNGWVMVERREDVASRSGNFTSLTDLLERADGRAYRLLVLRSHYRAPIEVTPETIADAERALARLDASHAGSTSIAGQGHWRWRRTSRGAPACRPRRRGRGTPRQRPRHASAVARLFEALSVANTAGDQGRDSDARARASASESLP